MCRDSGRMIRGWTGQADAKGNLKTVFILSDLTNARTLSCVECQWLHKWKLGHFGAVDKHSNTVKLDDHPSNGV